MKRTWTEKVLIGGGVLAMCAIVTWPRLPNRQAKAQEAKPAAVAPLPPAPEIPAAMGLRIRNVQLDQADLSNKAQVLAAQYTALQEQARHDQQELEQLKSEALREAKLDPKDWAVDVPTLKFVPNTKKEEAKKP